MSQFKEWHRIVWPVWEPGADVWPALASPGSWCQCGGGEARGIIEQCGLTHEPGSEGKPGLGSQTICPPWYSGQWLVMRPHEDNGHNGRGDQQTDGVTMQWKERGLFGSFIREKGIHTFFRNQDNVDTIRWQKCVFALPRSDEPVELRRERDASVGTLGWGMRIFKIL